MALVPINNNIFGIKGAIGRREYILNSSYVYLLTSLLTIPYTIWIFQHINQLFGISSILDIQNIVPLYVKILLIICWIIIIPFNFGFYTRRLNDIIGKDSDFITYIIAAGFILITYWVSFTGIGGYFSLFLILVAQILLLCIKGKVTGALPKDEVKRFNWGAFWGTWIWGLINRSYKTLWAIPASILFPIFPYVQIICGIKGNEWAYEKVKNKELEIFHKGQKNQAIFWNIFSGIVLFLLPVIAFIIIVLAVIGYTIANPDSATNAVNNYNQKVEAFVDNYFDNYELNSNENKFYIDPQTWLELSPSLRKSMLSYLATFAVVKKTDTQESSKTAWEEIIITKIYSSYNGEILSEFNANAANKEKIKINAVNAIEVNENPKLP